ncbi:hypothetical protein ACH5RR_027365 [Cinchona calisaya]|uniref:Uncharacterized protein n=1 Tax=Cinchona calisaya TaxID=153742 RepID=A0ABD2Z587_9GENT
MVPTKNDEEEIEEKECNRLGILFIFWIMLLWLAYIFAANEWSDLMKIVNSESIAKADKKRCLVYEIIGLLIFIIAFVFFGYWVRCIRRLVERLSSDPSLKDGQ